jgi:tRNA A-37 threonylcarbamoyl transferase component Bud32
MSGVSIRFSDLADAGRELALPACIELPGIAPLRLERLLRALPGRRYVGEGFWNGQKVLAKLLVGRKAARHFERERRGALLLAEQGLPAPRLFSAGMSGKEGGWLLFEFLDGAQSLGARWQALERQVPAHEVKAERQRILAAALQSIAALHLRGLWQEDLHLDNLLAWQGKTYLIDGAGIRAENPGQPLSRARTLQNLGLLFAQLPIGEEAHLETGLACYRQANPAFSPAADDLARLTRHVRRTRQWRIRDLMKKTGRDCGLFCVHKQGWLGAFGFCAVRRDEAKVLSPLLEDPDAFIARGHLCKAGGTATVARVDLAGRAFIVKRYNIKHLGHWLTRFWRPSRAWHSWREANRLVGLGIATAQPLAVVERRWLWLRGPAFLITEYLPGPDALAVFQSGQPPDAGEAGERAVSMPARLESVWQHELAALQALLADLRRARLCHGDCKGHNLIWQPAPQGEGGRWALIDLDAMRPYHSQRAAYRDRARLLRNWPQESPLFQWLEQHLP